jgi:hypothetical protein
MTSINSGTPLANPRQEIYAKMRARGMIPAKAAIAAGYASGSGVYTELESSPGVIVRIAEIMEFQEEQRAAKIVATKEAAKIVGQVTGMGKAWVLEKLAENAAMAQHEGDFKEANVALKLIGEEIGMFQGRSADDENASEVPMLDLDKLTALLPTQEAMLLQLPGVEKGFDADTALRLIEGQGAAAKRVRRERAAFNQDSEANIALTPEAEPDLTYSGDDNQSATRLRNPHTYSPDSDEEAPE